jgi:phosphoribosylaminoimidazole (AIR) synthetase
VLPVQELLRRIGNIPLDDWRRTFNLGIGMTWRWASDAGAPSAF